MNTVVVAGATGFIGSALTKRLLQEGKKVYAISTNEEKLKELKQYGDVVTIRANFDEYHKIPELITEPVDVWFHLAWQGVSSHSVNDLDMQLSNIKCTCESLILSKRVLAQKFVFASSVGKVRTQNVDGYSYNPSIYGITKGVCEDLLKTSAAINHMNINCAVFNNVYGVGDQSSRSTNSLIKQLKNGISPTLIKGEDNYDMIYIDDAISGLITIAQNGVDKKSYYVGSRELRWFKDIIKDLANIVAPNIELSFGGYSDDAYVDYDKINLDELYSDTGFVCKTDFEQSVIKTTKWLEKHNYWEKI